MDRQGRQRDFGTNRGVRFALTVIGILLGIVLGYLAWDRLAHPPSRSAAATIRVGIYQNAPKVYLDDSGTPSGLFIRLIREIAGKEHWNLAFVPCEWRQCLESLTAGEIDLMPDVAFSQARSRRFDFHRTPVAHSWSTVLVPAGESPHSLQDLDGLRIALLAGSIQTGPLQQLMTGLDLDYTAIAYPSYAKAFAAVRDGEADAVVSNNFHAASHAQGYGLHETPIVFDPAALYFATTPGDPHALLPLIDEYIDAWRFDEESVYYDALKVAMVPPQQAVLPPRIRRMLEIAAGLLVLLLVLTVVLRWQVRRRTAELRATTQRLDHMLDSSPVVLYQLAMDEGRISTLWVSDNVRRIFGFSPAEFTKSDGWRRHLHPLDTEVVLNNLGVLPKRGHLVQEYRIVDASGRDRFVRDEMQFVPGMTGHADEIVGTWNDLTESHEQQDRLSFLSHYDPLTRLPNRALLNERLEQSVHRARREGRAVTVLFIDVDRLKTINLSLGYSVGDEVLKKAALRLEEAVGRSDTLARIGDDGFVLVLENDAAQYKADRVMRDIVSRFEQPIHVADRKIALTVSVGASLFPIDADDPDMLLRHAEAAMHQAKGVPGNSCRLYSVSGSIEAVERLALENALRSAVTNDELLLHYQPQVDLASHEIVGLEALVRWNRPGVGLVPPDQFIPLAEEMGIIGEIGQWVLEEACRQTMELRAQGMDLPQIAVNLSVQQLDRGTLIPLVTRVLEHTGLEPESLELEITESIIMREPELATAALADFRRMGIQVAIDDFGTGYSSLSYLKNLPIDILKIDRSFVSNIGNDPSSEAITQSIIGLARNLRLKTIAEGIEQEHQVDFLRAEGCTIGQGYLFSAPVPADRLADVALALAE